ncbi:P-loop NTPase family protein [Mucilaginibacter ginkgonis]|uniref:Uncharacterized protein n=1 Tax=Mucilaginibacter ginkgonis TaxID=2682091 RepID=A0A7T7FD98_9SPHI|nr:hypothetical protein [Mucilaginibacter ginkgonis]QQL51231.1 hypothetical protein GO620_007225 [Mucilaginibacter ginkgonis]
MQAKAEEIDSAQRAVSNLTLAKASRKAGPSLQGQKIIRKVSYLEAYLNKPVGNFNIIPEGFFSNDKLIENEIDKFNKAQYQRQFILSAELPDRRALKSIDSQLQSLRANLATLIAHKKLTVNALKTDIAKRPVDNTSLLDNRNMAGVRSEIALVKTEIAAREQQSLELAEPVSYLSYHDHADRPGHYGIWYLAAAIVLLAFPFALTASQWRDDLHSAKITLKDVKKGNGFPSLVFPTDEALKGEAIDTFLNGLVTTIVQLPKDNPFAQIMLITTAGNFAKPIALDLDFAGRLSALNKNVLLIDYNIEAPFILESFGMSYSKGLRTYFENEKTLADLIIVSDKHPGVSFIGAGPDLAEKNEDVINFLHLFNEGLDQENRLNPEKSTSDQLISKLVDHYKLSFDYILVAIPDLNTVDRSSELYKLSDTRMYLVDDNNTQLISTEF